jgi:AraC family transcriptional regulator
MISVIGRDKELMKPGEYVQNNSRPRIWLEYKTCSPMQAPARSLDYHTIEINIGEPVTCYRKDGANRSVCNTGNIVYLSSPGDVHEMRWDGAYKSLKIIFEPKFVDGIVDVEAFRFQTMWNVDDAFCHELAIKLEQELSLGVCAQQIYVDTLLLALVIHLATQYPANRKRIFAPKGKLSSQQLNSVIEFTRAGIHKNIRLSELADCVHLSEFHFARLFRQTVGVSPYKFVLQMKIGHAQNLMRERKKSFSDIAYMLNFSDQAHFSHVFKKITGFSPRNYLSSAA